MSEKKSKGGRPPKYTSADQIAGIIDQYFEDCKGHVLTDKSTGLVMRDKNGNPIYVERHPPTVTGLALALGFNSRMSLINYQGKKEFMVVITRAKSRIEEYLEMRLLDKDGAMGAKFSLQNSFKGWNEASKDAANAAAAAAVKIICDIPREAPAPKEAESDASTE